MINIFLCIEPFFPIESHDYLCIPGFKFVYRRAGRRAGWWCASIGIVIWFNFFAFILIATWFGCRGCIHDVGGIGGGEGDTVNSPLNESAILDKKLWVFFGNGIKLIILDEMWGECCNSHLYLNTETDETSPYNLEGYKNGCGCVLNSKTRVPEAMCPVKKW